MADAAGVTGRGAVVLVSGGLDSAVTLASARGEGYDCAALTVDYGQRHSAEIEAAARVASSLGASRHVVVRMDLRTLGGSALTGDVDVPKDRDDAAIGAGIPATYVPARNMVFLSLAVGWAEALWPGRDVDVFIGVNAVDFSGYPDCREPFVRALERAAKEGTRAGSEGHAIRVHTPLLTLRKASIVRLGVKLGVDFALTRSCYDPPPAGAGQACGRCDACALRRKGFEEAGVADPTVYAAKGAVR